MNTEKTSSKRRADRLFHTGGWAVLAVAIVLAALILLNVVVRLLPESWINYDMTAVKLYSIGEQTKAIVADIDEPVTVYWLVSEGNEDTTIEELLQRYQELSDKITVEKVDATSRPNFATAYTSASLYQNSLIVESAKRFKVLNYTNIYVTEYEYAADYTVTNTTTSFQGENALTGALDYVTTDVLPVVYYLSGHGEPGFDSDLEDRITAQNFTVTDLTLMNADAFPEDCAALVIDSPASDLYEGEAEMILDYIADGGKVILLTNYGQAAMPNLEKITDAFGVYTEEGVVLEGDRDHYYQYPIYMLPKVEKHSVTGSLATDGMYVMYYLGQGIEKADDIADDLTVQPLLTSSDDAYIKVDAANSQTLEKEEGDLAGPFDLAVLVRNETNRSHLVWYTTGALLNTGINDMVSGNNFTLMVNTLGFLCEHESAISIEGKNISTEMLLVPTSAAGWWKILYTVLLPVACVAVGIVTFVRRRMLR